MQISNNERNLRICLSRIDGVGPMTFLKILNNFQTVENFLHSNRQQKIDLFGEVKGSSLADKISAFDFDKFLSSIKNENLVVYGDSDYPELLYQMTDPPIVVYYRGDISKINKSKIITVVGTRKNTNYSVDILKDFISNLSSYGYAFASGLALGVDSIVHRLSLENNALTFAVIGTPVNKIYPSSNATLADKIVKAGGIILSEYHDEDKLSAANFARRNRILAALSKSTVVIEAPEKSGALITAHLAFDYGREVYAFPSNIFAANSKGNNKIIKMQKAQLIEDYSDFIYFHEKTNILKPKKEFDINSLNDEERKIIELLNINNLDVDSIKSKFDIDTSKLLASLMKLEIKELISKNEFDEYYTKVLIN